ncbi:carboxypeptidase regulatory-like domain-containing protein [Xanthomonas citri pv. anacardii]|uniref:carboxypeptidase-like regulatory domain-containing protein n=1 Tax=Xanthomonas citri TaxID=346 RepID=UPI000CCC8CAE|nr:carboxypeptidase-like regulatory domain-containing protein [Xanthomonas citri]MCT8358365.1 carboxypeptidase regulatory-like domain-containing protein [Xanthomonas citri pv. anacardii]MCT8362417.1 carboxypeptidase regulatory-like domain-containing protein [Xanthomonas citri pv. anacardii]MCT8366481.1 carboxypeptidase regulatory-like domain-containing protein [Xanthomonas citri pv. anacardii]MCT8370502.1 carboxypeptidase regulatory-like domain-containing protein [Xanthomonas citri pv. anacardi
MTLSLPWLVGAALLLIAVIGCMRLVRAHQRQPYLRTRLWLLLAAQPLLAALLYPVLLPPPRAGTGGELHVATAGTAAGQVSAGDLARWVALPEAPALPGVMRVPDLATALRRTPETTALVVHGSGLPARDREGLNIPLRLKLNPAPRGLVAVWPPPPVSPGDTIAVAAQVQGLPDAHVELLDPAGQVVDSAVADRAGRVRLRGLARAPGQVLFVVRARDAAGAERSRVEVPVLIAAMPTARVLLLAGAPQPELKYLRRWASDAGLEVRSQIAVGPGVQLGEGAALDAASLDRLDLLIVDPRRLVALGPAQRQTVRAAIQRGLGVLVRTDGPLDAGTRAALAELGLDVSGGGTSRPVPAPQRLSPPVAPADPAGSPGDAPTLAPLQRRDLQPQATDALVAARADDGSALGWWRAQGRGRIGIGLVEDSFALVLAGRSDLHAALWAQLSAAVARPGGALPTPVQDGWSQHRMTLCDLRADAWVTDPDRARHPLLPERNGDGPRCAGYWPTTPGWHRLDSSSTHRWLYVRAPNDAQAMYAQQLRAATIALTGGTSFAPFATPATQPGARWPWLLAWLSAAAALWWFERRRPSQRLP